MKTFFDYKIEVVAPDRIKLYKPCLKEATKMAAIYAAQFSTLKTVLAEAEWMMSALTQSSVAYLMDELLKEMQDIKEFILPLSSVQWQETCILHVPNAELRIGTEYVCYMLFVDGQLDYMRMVHPADAYASALNGEISVGLKIQEAILSLEREGLVGDIQPMEPATTKAFAIAKAIIAAHG